MINIIPEIVPITYETRDVLDELDNVIGTLTLPVGTPEETWTQLLGIHNGSVPTIDSPNAIQTTSASASSQVTTSSGTAAVIGSMEMTPVAGTYVALFSGNIFTGGASAQGEFGIYVNGVLIPETKRNISCNLQLLGGLVTISLNTIGVGTYTGTQVTLNGSQTIDVRYRSVNGGTIGFTERVFTLLKVK